jgi:hypothetical protein
MLPLSARDLLKVWEAGEHRHPLDRALTILAAACPELSWDELAALSVGQRDARLLAVREQTSGPRLEGFVECPLCAEELEFGVMVADLRAAEPSTREEAWELRIWDLSLRFRLPDSLDLGAAAACPDPAAARGLLARRCVLQASRDGKAVAPEELPASVVSTLGEQMVEHDPQAEVLLDLRCPVCEHRWEALFDVASFLWEELAAQAERLLREVHALAGAYGWSETEILGLNARRRRYYLEMAT